MDGRRNARHRSTDDTDVTKGVGRQGQEPATNHDTVPEPAGKKPPAADFDVDAFLSEAKKQLGDLGKQFKEVTEKLGDEAQYHFDKELARALAKHPDLYAEVRKTLRQIKKTADKTAEAFGLKPE